MNEIDLNSLNLCRIIDEFYPRIGGHIVHTLNLAKSMNKYCKNQFIITSQHKGLKRYEEIFGLKVYRERMLDFLPFSAARIFSYLPFALKRILWLYKKYGIDLIHVHGPMMLIPAVIAGKIIRKPVVGMMHGTMDAYKENLREGLMTRLFPTDHIFVLSDGTHAVKKFEKLLGKEKVTIVSHAIEKCLCKSRNRDTILLKKLGLENKFVLTSTSSLINIKGHSYAIKAVKKLLDAGCNDIVYLIVGSGNKECSLRQLAKNLRIDRNVLFLGDVTHEDIFRYLSITNIFLAVSTYSNKNNSTLEAMMCGKPIVAFNSGGTEEYIKDRCTGLLADTKNYNDLSRKIHTLYERKDLQRDLSNNAIQFIKDYQNLEDRVNIELGIYKKILKNNR